MDYYWFCLPHVQKYNASWDFLAGHSPGQIEQKIRESALWDRPTWPIGEGYHREREVSDRLSEIFGNGDEKASPYTQGANVPPPMGVGEKDALAALGLEPPVDFIDIKAQYRLLVKIHHPDANGGSLEAEEKFKDINQAFALLRRIYQVEETAL